MSWIWGWSFHKGTNKSEKHRWSCLHYDLGFGRATFMTDLKTHRWQRIVVVSLHDVSLVWRPACAFLTRKSQLARRSFLIALFAHFVVSGQVKRELMLGWRKLGGVYGMGI